MKPDIVKLIKQHQHSKLNLEIQDVYKMIYQSVFGVAHILGNQFRAKRYLEQELNLIEPSADEELIENISVTGDVVRLNLRPFKFQNGNSTVLFHGMQRSAREIKGSQEQFLRLWDQFKNAVLEGKLNFDKKALLEFDRKILSSDYQVMHHSKRYKNANRPAYRILTKQHAEKLLSALS